MKNYKNLYESGNDSIALEQKWFVKEETTRGQLIFPLGTDFLQTLGGGTTTFNQPFESSPHRSGRHHTNIIKKKKEMSWNFSTYFNIDTTAPAGITEIDPACRLLWRSMLGTEVVNAGVQYTTSVPSTSFSLFEIGDKFCKQSRGCFVQGANATFPGDGEAMVAWTGAGAETIYVGIGKSTTANSGNTVTLQAGDGYQFKKAEGGYVMIIHADGVTRSTDTPDGMPRKIVSIVGDVVTLDGAPLSDADGSVTSAPVYLSYYEPAVCVAINNPVTGLVGSFAIPGYANLVARTVSVNMQNDHELVNYGYGTDSLSGPLYVAGNRMTATVSVEVNMNKQTLKLLHNVQNFEAQMATLILGSATGRHLEVTLPKLYFPVPTVSIPDTGSIPVTFEGNAYQTTDDAADEVSIYFK